MTFSRANALGWGVKETLTSTQINTIDLNQSRAVDGYAGGSWSPSAPIYITGFRFSSASANVVTSGGSITVNTGASVSCAGKSALGGASLPGSDGQTNLGGTTTVVSGATLSCGSGGTLAVANGASCTIGTSGMSCAGVISLTGIGRIQWRPNVSVPTGTPKTLSVADGDVFYGNPSADADYTLANPVTAGAKLRVINESSHTITVKDFGGATIGTLVPSNNATGYYAADFYFGGSQWEVELRYAVIP